MILNKHLVGNPLVWIAALALSVDSAFSANIFRCDFESDSWWEEWGERKQPPRTATLSADSQRKFATHRGKALRIRVDKGGHYGASLSFQFLKRTGKEPEEVFFRYYLRFSDDWKPVRGGKLPGIGGTYGRAGWGGRKVNGTDGWSARGLFEGLKEGRTPIGFYCYHADMKGKYGDNWEWDHDGFSGLENNRWYCVEQQARLNTPAKNDGILRGWIDGTLVFEKTDVRMRDVSTLKIETIWLNLYYGGSWTAPDDFHVYIDDVAISDRRIGFGKDVAKERLETLGGKVFEEKETGDVVEVVFNGNDRLTDAHLVYLSEFASLTDLSLEETAVTSAGLRHIAGLKQLEWLNLWKTRIDDGGLSHLTGLKNLQSLPIGGTRVTDNGLAHLKEMSELTYLGLRDTAVTHVGVSHISTLPKLSELNLRGTKTNDAVIPTLITMKSLKKLWLGGTGLTQEDINRLRPALPGCAFDLTP